MNRPADVLPQDALDRAREIAHEMGPLSQEQRDRIALAVGPYRIKRTQPRRRRGADAAA